MDVMNSGAVLVVDEIEASMHPLLTRHLIEFLCPVLGRWYVPVRYRASAEHWSIQFAVPSVRCGVWVQLSA